MIKTLELYSQISEYLEDNQKIRFHHHRWTCSLHYFDQDQTPLLMYVVQCRIWVTPWHFINQVRPTWNNPPSFNPLYLVFHVLYKWIHFLNYSPLSLDSPLLNQVCSKLSYLFYLTMDVSMSGYYTRLPMLLIFYLCSKTTHQYTH